MAKGMTLEPISKGLPIVYRPECMFCKRMGKRSKVDTMGLINGLVMVQGCEWHMRMLKKKVAERVKAGLPLGGVAGD